MRNLAIYGAGGLGREVACLIERINKHKVEAEAWKIVGFFDDGKEKGAQVSHFGKVLGGMAELNAWPDELHVVLAFGSPRTIKIVHSKITNAEVRFPNIIDPSFYISDRETFSIGEGNIIQGSGAVTVNVTIGNFNLLNGYNVLGHDVVIGDYNVLMPGARISGEVKIGELNLIGADSFIRQQLTVGNGITLSPLSALLTKPKDGGLYMGNPARLMKY